MVSHSLGSYLIFSMLNDGETTDAAARYILERTSLVYFFANQISLLEMVNVGGSKVSELAHVEGVAGSFSKQMENWGRLRQAFGVGRGSSGAEEFVAKPRQVIAWSDPSDLLSWDVPAVDGLAIYNFHVRNTRWHWLIAGPESRR